MKPTVLGRAPAIFCGTWRGFNDIWSWPNDHRDCGRCGRSISVPTDFRGQPAWCLVCGLTVQLIPLIEIPPCLGLYAGCLTAEECLALLTGPPEAVLPRHDGLTLEIP